MKKFNWIITICAFMIAIAIGCKTKFETTRSTEKAVVSNAKFERGKVLAFSICAGCHYDKLTNKFIGTQIMDVPGIAGKIFSANLTHTPGNSVADKYTDSEIKYLFRTGIARDGRFLNYMLRPNMSDEDIDAVIVYLRSKDLPLQPVDASVAKTHLTFIGKAYMGFKADPVAYKASVKMPNDKVAMGYYLVDNLGCFHCHSKKLTALNYLYPDQTKGYLAGGIKFKGPKGIEVVASNITPDKNTGIGNYTQQQFLKAIKEGLEPDGGKLKEPMPKFDMLKDEEINAIYAYLQTIPAKAHKVE